MRAMRLLVLAAAAILPACGDRRSAPPADPPPLAGDFFRVGYEEWGAGSDRGSAGTVTFSPPWTCLLSLTTNLNGTISSLTGGGSYSGVVGGPFQWSNAITDVYSGAVSPAGDLVISGTAVQAGPAIFVDVRKGGGTRNNSTLAGTYYNVGYAWQPAASPYHYTITGLLTFDGTGNWTTTMTGNREGTIVTGATNTGSYAVAPDGTVTLSDPATSFLGATLPGGELLTLGTFTSGARVEIVLCVRKGGTFTAASLKGEYQVVALGSTPPGHDHFSSTGTCTFDGVGTLTWTGIQTRSGITHTSLDGMTESYTVAPDGSLTIVNSGIGGGLTLSGGVGAGGQLAVVSAITAGNRLETRLLVKK